MKNKNNIKIILAHLTFWLLLAAIPFLFNADLFGFSTALVRTIIPVSLIIIMAYGNTLGIIPFLFRRKNFVWHTPLVAYIIVIPLAMVTVDYIFGFVNHITNIQVTLIFEAHKDGLLISTNKSQSGFPRTVIGLIVLLTFFVSSLYGFAIEFIRRDRQEVLLKATNLKNELQLLRRQINPHFLFNALNNLYAIIQLKPQQAGDFVLKLSDMFRYVTYDCQYEKVSLSKEINYLNNYIYFQKWRDQNFQDISIDFATNLETYQIEPMLLIPFVENAFKHSYGEPENSPRKIAISLKINEQKQLIFEVYNTISANNTQEAVPDEYTGIGIENVRKRLELLYGSQHQLQLQKSNSSFLVQLTISI